MAKVYHYTSLEKALEFILPSMTLRTNSLHYMNDPKENHSWSFGGGGMGLEELYPDIYSRDNHINLQYKLGDEIKSSCQIICFVSNDCGEGILNEMMWAQYAQNHRGLCLEIDEDKFIEENETELIDFSFEAVTYGPHESLIFWANRNLTKDENIKAFVKKEYKRLFLHKSTYWERENEKRLLLFHPYQKYLSIKNSLTGVYIGLSMPYSYRPCIDNLIDEQQTNIYDLYYESNTIKICPREKGDFRPLIGRIYNR